jgi:hypothetical protein
VIPKHLSKIKELHTGQTLEVVDRLASQFTAEDKNGAIRFFFYKDRGVEWEFGGE